jgi:hypothetical protein
MQLWCRKQSPFAAPRATRFRRCHGIGRALLADLAVAQQGHQVAVLDLAQRLHLCGELAVALVAEVDGLLDGDAGSVLERGLEHLAKPAGPDQASCGEAVGDLDQLREGQAAELALEGGHVDAQRLLLRHLPQLPRRRPARPVLQAAQHVSLTRLLPPHARNYHEKAHRRNNQAKGDKDGHDHHGSPVLGATGLR